MEATLGGHSMPFTHQMTDSGGDGVLCDLRDKLDAKGLIAPYNHVLACSLHATCLKPFSSTGFPLGWWNLGKSWRQPPWPCFLFILV